MTDTALKQKKCESCEGIGSALQKEQAKNLMTQLDKAWHLDADHKKIKRDFKFNNFYETMAFMNAVAWLAHQENHHPDVTLGYNYCHLTLWTHALHGLTMNDFICAAKIDHILEG